MLSLRQLMLFTNSLQTDGIAREIHSYLEQRNGKSELEAWMQLEVILENILNDLRSIVANSCQNLSSSVNEELNEFLEKSEYSPFSLIKDAVERRQCRFDSGIKEHELPDPNYIAERILDRLQEADSGPYVAEGSYVHFRNSTGFIEGIICHENFSIEFADQSSLGAEASVFGSYVPTKVVLNSSIHDDIESKSILEWVDEDYSRCLIFLVRMSQIIPNNLPKPTDYFVELIKSNVWEEERLGPHLPLRKMLLELEGNFHYLAQGLSDFESDGFLDFRTQAEVSGKRYQPRN